MKNEKLKAYEKRIGIVEIWSILNFRTNLKSKTKIDIGIYIILRKQFVIQQKSIKIIVTIIAFTKRKI